MKSPLVRVQKSLIVFNIILAVISLICLLSAFYFDCWTFKLSYKPDGKEIKKLLEDSMPDDSKSYIDAVDWDKFDSQTLNLNVSVNTMDTFNAIFADENTVVKRLLDRQIDSLMAQARPIADTMLKVTAEAFLEVTLMQIENSEDSSETMELADFESVIDNYLNNTITKDSAVNQIVDIAALEIPKTTGEEFSDSDRQKVKDNFEALITPIEDCRGEDGKLDMMSIVYDKLAESGVFTNDEDDVPTGDQVINVIKQNLYDKLESSGIVTYISIGMQVLAALILVQSVPWLFLLLFATIRIFMRRKATRLTFVRIFTWMPHVILVGIPSLLLILAKMIKPSFLESIGFDKFSVSFSSITSLSAGGALVVTVIAIAFYKGLKRQEKDALEDEKSGTDVYPDMHTPIQSNEHLNNDSVNASAEFMNDKSMKV